MSEVYDKLIRCYESVRRQVDFVPEVALVLGSGLGDYADFRCRRSQDMRGVLSLDM